MIGILFSGQGSQKAGMGKDIYETYPMARDFYDGLKLPFDLKEVSFEGDQATLSKTIYTQPTLVALHLAILRVLKDKGLEIGAVAGLSLGEYSALVVAGVLSEEEAMEIIVRRAGYMSRSCQENPSFMAAILYRDEDRARALVEEVGQECFIEVANVNCPGQIVVGMRQENLQDLEEAVDKAKGIRLRVLEVEGAFHTSLMDGAAARLEEDFSNVDFVQPNLPIYMNITGQAYQGEDLADMMARQAASTTRFQDSLTAMIDGGVRVFLEVGKNDIFKGFMKKIDRDIEVIPVHSVETIEALEEIIGG